MKIHQQISFGKGEDQTGSLTYSPRESYFCFDPALYSGIQHIYFEIAAYCGMRTDNVYIQLYDTTNNAEVCVLQFTTDILTRKVSEDIADHLTTLCNLEIRVKIDGADSPYNGIFDSPALNVEQEDATATKKSASYFPLCNYNSKYHYGWSSAGADMIVDPHIASFDGTVNAYFEVWLRAESSSLAYARLYDVTGGYAVSGSSIYTASTVPARVKSDPITLISGHKYRVEITPADNYKSAYLYGSWIVITSENFTKIAALAVAFNNTGGNNGNDWFDCYGLRAFPFGKVTGPKSLVWGWDTQAHINGYTGDIKKWRLFNKTLSEEVPGTYNFTYTDVHATIHEENTPIIPLAADELKLQRWGYGCENRGPDLLIAYQEEVLTGGQFVPPDPGMPTGYHCFMSSFIKNIIAGHVPLKTPDGVNRCY